MSPLFTEEEERILVEIRRIVKDRPVSGEDIVAILDTVAEIMADGMSVQTIMLNLRQMEMKRWRKIE